jgi:hypothetical protein
LSLVLFLFSVAHRGVPNVADSQLLHRGVALLALASLP